MNRCNQILKCKLSNLLSISSSINELPSHGSLTYIGPIYSYISGQTVLFLCISRAWILLDEGLEDGKKVLMGFLPWFVRKIPISRSVRRDQQNEIASHWRQSLSKSSGWMLTMSKGITSGEIAGPLSLLAMRVATDLLSHEALPGGFQDCSPYRARE
jgi:hypothetical protein